MAFDKPSTPLLDNFNRADGAPGPNWNQAVSAYSVPPIASNLLSWPQFPSVAWIEPFTGDQEIWDYNPSGGGGSLLLRFNNLNTGTETGYDVGCANNSGTAVAFSVNKWTAGVATNEVFNNGAVPPNYPYGWATAIGNVITGYASPDNVTWTQVGQYIDTSSPYLSGGYIGLYSANNGTAGTVDNFGGGSLNPSWPFKRLPILKGP